MRVVLVERGARDVQLRDGSPADVVVIAQGADPAAEFAARALARVSLMLSQRRAIEEALIAVADTQSVELGAARAVVARALALHMFATGGGSIIFGASSVMDTAVRHQLLGLADVLVDETGGSVVSVTVRFGVPSHAEARDADDDVPAASVRRPRKAVPRRPVAVTALAG